jgi:hypothetical protein
VNENILLITGNDDTYRQPLLEAQGYFVLPVQIEQALDVLNENAFQLVLVTTESGIAETLSFCEQLKALHPTLRVGILAQRAEYIPPNGCSDIVVRAQYSPAKFLAAVKRLFESTRSEGYGVLVEDDGGD